MAKTKIHVSIWIDLDLDKWNQENGTYETREDVAAYLRGQVREAAANRLYSSTRAASLEPQIAGLTPTQDELDARADHDAETVAVDQQIMAGQRLDADVEHRTY